MIRQLRQDISLFIRAEVITMLFFGFSSGLPILLIFSTLSLWLNEAGVEKSAITYFSWAALGYSFKFVWAPLIDRLPLPFLTQILGRRRAWILVAQLAIITAILLMASIDPQQHVDSLTHLALAAVLLGFASATQDIVIDAYRIELSDKSLQSMLSASYVAGYRLGMLVAGAGALFLAAFFGTSKEAYDYSAWALTYTTMAGVMLVGIVTTLVVKEASTNSVLSRDYHTQDYLRFLLLFIAVVLSFIAIFVAIGDLIMLGEGVLARFISEVLHLIIALGGALILGKILVNLGVIPTQMLEQTYLMPVRDFFSRYGWQTALLLLAIIGFYRVSDIVLGVISNVFYQDMGFSKIEIASISKTYGLFMTILGGFIGGILATRVGVFKILFLGALLSMLTNLLFVMLAQTGHNISMLYWVISFDNLAAGLATAAFVAFLSSLTNIQFTAVQYAIFSSLMTLFPKLLGGYSGTMVASLGYSQFFIITTLLGVPVLYLVWRMRRYI